MSVFRVEKNRDYTVMSNHHLKNKNLSLKAKGMLSLMLSLPDNWDYTTEGLSYICKEGIDAICSAVNELEKHGYITRERLRDEKGRLKSTDYVIREQPIETEVKNNKNKTKEAKTPKRENPVLDNPILDNPVQENPILDEPVLEKPEQENPAQLNIDIINTLLDQSKKEKENTNGVNKNQSITNPINPQRLQEPETFKTNSNENDDRCDIDRYIHQIKENIEYDILCERFDVVRVDEAVEVMLELICTKSSIITIGKEEYPAEMVRRRILKLDSSHIEYIFLCLDKNTTKVYNISKYLRTALFNASATEDSYFRAEANHDLHEMGMK